MRCLIACLCIFCSCATIYEPRHSPRIAVIMVAGEEVAVVDGVRYPIGTFMGDLDRAVANNPAALEHADAYYSNNTTGLLALIVGELAAIGIPLYAVSASESCPGCRNDGPSGRVVALGLLGGLGLIAVGGVLLGSAQPHKLDAINIYNDSVDLPPAATR